MSTLNWLMVICACCVEAVLVVPYPRLCPKFLQLHWLEVLTLLDKTYWFQSLVLTLWLVWHWYFVGTVIVAHLSSASLLSPLVFGFWVCLAVIHNTTLASLNRSQRPSLSGGFPWYWRPFARLLITFADFLVFAVLEGVSIISLLEGYHRSDALLHIMSNKRKYSW